MTEELKSAVGATLNRLDEKRIDDSLANATPSGNAEQRQTTAEMSETESNAGGEDKQLVSDVLVDLERMIITDDWLFAGEKPTEPEAQKGHKKRRFVLPSLDQLGRSVVTSYSLKNYVELLQPHHRSSIANWLYQNSSAVFTKLFRFPNSTVVFHSEQFDGLLRVVRIALHSRFPNLVASGYTQFAERPPVIYVSSNVCYGGIEQFFSFELGIVDARTIPVLKGPIGTEAMDLTLLESMMAKDVEEGRVPTLVIAAAGSHMLGTSDNFEKLQVLKDKFGFWLHLDGLDVAGLGLTDVTPSLTVMRNAADSFFLPLGQWIGVPAVPYITVHKSVEFIRPNYAEKLAALPWWVVTRHLGTEGIVSRLQNSFALTTSVIQSLQKYPQLSVICESAASPAVSPGKSSQTRPTVVLFKYNFPAIPGSDEKEDLLFDDQYQDALNTWIGQGLCTDCRQMGMQLVNIHNHGVCTRYCALENSSALRTSLEHVVKFSKQLDSVMSIVEATVTARRQSREIVPKFPSLRLVDVHKWAGVGAVIFVPTMLKDVHEWNEKQHQQVSHLNIELVHVLRSNDHAFSLGESSSGLSCVKFGMLANSDDLEDLIALVAKMGKEIEESSKYIESMADLVRQGIEAANADLKQENENRLVQEGVLRQVPLVGSLLNWWSPLPKEVVAVKGRAFDLVSGNILSTDSVYKQHMQMARGDIAESPPQTPAQLHGVGLDSESDGDDQHPHVADDHSEAVGNGVAAKLSFTPEK